MLPTYARFILPCNTLELCLPIRGSEDFLVAVGNEVESRGELVRMRSWLAKFNIGQVVRHRIFPFRGVIFDVDPAFDNSEEWWLSIPENLRPRKDQPFYHLLAENEETDYIAYVSEQNLLPDDTGKPIHHPQVKEMFGKLDNGTYELLHEHTH